jgi:hypothetical protein
VVAIYSVWQMRDGSVIYVGPHQHRVRKDFFWSVLNGARLIYYVRCRRKK